MDNNPFKIIRPTEEPPKELRKEVMGSVRTVVLILRFVQLFVGDYSSVLMNLFKTQTENDNKDKPNKGEENSTPEN